MIISPRLVDNGSQAAAWTTTQEITDQVLEALREIHDDPNIVWFDHTEVLAATNEWKNIEDPIGRFMAEELVFVPSARVTAGQLYEAYRCWCEGEGRPPRSKKNFLNEFQTRPEFIANEVEVIRPRNVLTFLNVGQKSPRVMEVSHD